VNVAKPNATFLILIKPQFELPRNKVAPGGIVKGKKLQEIAVLSVRKNLNSLGLKFLNARPSRVPGAGGNQEYFLHARKKSG
jgi:23S rRNA (cytidine1920-2'-O)/16S rRNA (cytidine1409-2'-O)-methyltransferase